MRLMLPREHGAWGMLLLPFLSALLLARKLSWEVVPAAVASVGVFVIREPLVVLWRQARVWKQQRPETAQARRSLACYLLAIAVCGVGLLVKLPSWPLLAMGGAAAALTALSAYLTVQNRQRSLMLQLASAAGLTGSALLAWLAAGAGWESKIWWLWGAQAAHSTAALLAVHARLEARIAARTASQAGGSKWRAALAQGVLATVAIGCASRGRPGLAVALAFSAAVHTFDLMRLPNREFLQIPVRRVGLRELALSIAFSGLVVAGLW